MHKHPTPVAIKGHIFKEMVAVATERNIESYAILSMMDAVDVGIRAANEEHRQLKESGDDRSN